jgi:hypothetical protein
MAASAADEHAAKDKRRRRAGRDPGVVTVADADAVIG